VFDPVLVDDRVRGDQAGDEHGQERAAPAPESAYEQDPDTDEQHPGHLPRRRLGAGEHDAARKHEHGRQAARERIDDGELGPAVRVGEQHEVGQLESRGGDQVRPDRCVELPEEEADRRADDGADEQYESGESLRVACPREQKVPDRVDEGRGQREGECLSGQIYVRIAASSTGR
jgi:hypothetical protein